MKFHLQFPPKEYFLNYNEDPDIKRDMEEVINFHFKNNFQISKNSLSTDRLQMYRQSDDTNRKVILLQFDKPKRSSNDSFLQTHFSQTTTGTCSPYDRIRCPRRSNVRSDDHETRN